MRAALVVAVLLAACSSKTKPKRLDAAVPPVDAPVDTAADPCAACTADQQCVQRFNGTCGLVTSCELREGRNCPTNTCSAECEQAYCPSPYQCQTRPPCGTESPTAFHCYGP